MLLRDIIILSVCIIIAAGLMIGAGMQLDSINRQRQDMDLIIDRPENIPPSLAFATVATGAFRGLLVDVLWMRADKLKEQGNFFDAKQLAEWITTLQPRFASVWEFQAWNMAYNISVAIPATQPDQRWRWVKNGYELLRDQGIPLNPKSIELYRELARIFQHKIGGVSDDAHKYYKLQLAMAMEPLLGPADDDYFDALSKAPVRWEEIIADPNVEMLISALKSSDKAFSDSDYSMFVSNYLSLRQNAGRYDPNSGRVIDDYRGTEALEKFDIFAKACQLRNTWKLEPRFMVELNKMYGPIDWDDPNKHLPLDWRHPDCHAMYWAVKGLQAVSGDKSREIEAEEVNTDRIVGHCLQDLFRNGKIFVYDVPVQLSQDSSSQQSTILIKEVFLRPDLRMFKSYNETVLAVLEKYKKLERKGTYESLQNGHRNMLKNALFSFYQSGHRGYAQQVYNELKTRYPLPEFDVPLVVYVRNRLHEELKDIVITDAMEMIEMMLMESYFRYAMRDDDEAAGLESMAMEIHKYYQSMYKDENRIDLPEFPLLRYFALMDFLNDRQYPPNLGRNLIGRIKIEKPELAELLEKQEEQLIKQSEQTK